MPESDHATDASAKTLVVLGAGPKGVAIAAKHAVLKHLGWKVPDLVVIDRSGVAAHWVGTDGFTDGRQHLGTPPEKDVGFPYRSTHWGLQNGEVSEMMLKLFSWPAYLIQGGRYADWVDRGRPAPQHGDLGKYLQWIASQLKLDVKLAELSQIGFDGHRWILSCSPKAKGKPLKLNADGIVFTGPGIPRQIKGQIRHPRITTGSSFWKEFDVVQSQLTEGSNVCVVGTGETAAAIVVKLSEMLGTTSRVDVLSRQGFLFSRGESFAENRLYSDPGEEWLGLPESHRRNFVRRTDRGVFSAQAMNRLNQAFNVQALAGEAIQIEPTESMVLLTVEFTNETVKLPYEHVVVAMGFDPLWFASALDEEAMAALRRVVGDKVDADRVEMMIDEHLAIAQLRPAIHLPMLAGVSRGPGFPNLSCLGLLADRILSAYASR